MDEFTKRVYKMLDKMKVGESGIVSKLCRPENRKAFVQTIKDYIDEKDNFDFSNDYEIFTKRMNYFDHMVAFNTPHDFMPAVHQLHKDLIKANGKNPWPVQ